MTNEPIDARIGARIGSLRAARNIAKEAAAEKLGVPVEYYEVREAGQSRFSAVELTRLCEMFEVSIHDIYIGIAHHCSPKAQRRH